MKKNYIALTLEITANVDVITTSNGFWGGDEGQPVTINSYMDSAYER